MGCHTWVAKKLSALTEKEKQDRISESLKDYKNIYPYKSAEDYKKTMLEWYKEEVEEYDKNFANGRYKNLSEKELEKITKTINKWRVFVTNPDKLKEEYSKLMKEKSDAITLLEHGGEEAFKFAISKLSYPDLVVYKKEKYLHINFDYPFRVYTGYSDKKVVEEDKLLDYLKNGGERVGYYDDTTRKFIEGYTNELVNRIKEFFIKHGKDNLLFHFS